MQKISGSELPGKKVVLVAENWQLLSGAMWEAGLIPEN
jgi:hypothetical protein